MYSNNILVEMYISMVAIRILNLGVSTKNIMQFMLIWLTQSSPSAAFSMTLALPNCGVASTMIM